LLAEEKLDEIDGVLEHSPQKFLWYLVPEAGFRVSNLLCFQKELQHVSVKML
jgi:hypothetical protein